MTDAQRDGLLGAVTGVFALAYIASARGIEDSLLADEVGAGGVPQAAGILMLLASVALIVKSWWAGRSRPPAPAPAPTNATAPRPWRASALLLLVLVGYALVLPILGYIVSISLLVLAVAIVGGARGRLTLVACTALSGLALWAMFDLALKVRMPVGTLFG